MSNYKLVRKEPTTEIVTTRSKKALDSVQPRTAETVKKLINLAEEATQRDLSSQDIEFLNNRLDRIMMRSNNQLESFILRDIGEHMEKSLNRTLSEIWNRVAKEYDLMSFKDQKKLKMGIDPARDIEVIDDGVDTLESLVLVPDDHPHRTEILEELHKENRKGMLRIIGDWFKKAKPVELANALLLNFKAFDGIDPFELAEANAEMWKENGKWPTFVDEVEQEQDIIQFMNDYDWTREEAEAYIEEIVRLQKEAGDWIEDVELVANDEDDFKYLVIERGGSIGTKEDYWKGSIRGRIVKEFDNKEDATEFAKRMRKTLTPGEKSYYGMGYNVVKEAKIKADDADQLIWTAVNVKDLVKGNIISDFRTTRPWEVLDTPQKDGKLILIKVKDLYTDHTRIDTYDSADGVDLLVWRNSEQTAVAKDLFYEEENEPNVDFYEVLWYEGIDEVEALRGDFLTETFDTLEEAMDFYEECKDDKDKFAFWVTSRDADGDLIEEFVLDTQDTASRDIIEELKAEDKKAFDESDLEFFYAKLGKAKASNDTEAVYYWQEKIDEILRNGVEDSNNYRIIDLQLEGSSRRYLIENVETEESVEDDYGNTLAFEYYEDAEDYILDELDGNII